MEAAGEPLASAQMQPRTEDPDIVCDDDGTVALVEAVRQEVRLMRLAFECWSCFLVVLHGHRAVRFVVPLFR